MIKIIVGTTLNRKTVIEDENKTLKQILEENEIDYSRGMTQLDGATLGAGDLEKTFADFGILDHCSLLNIVKADNA